MTAGVLSSARWVQNTWNVLLFVSVKFGQKWSIYVWTDEFYIYLGLFMGTNCAPLLADLFLYSYEAEFVQRLLKAGKKHLAKLFNFTYRYTADELSLKNRKLAEYLEFIYPRELEIKEITETAAPLYIWIVISILTVESLLLRFRTNWMTSIFPLLTFHFWAVISLLHQHTAFTYHS